MWGWRIYGYTLHSLKINNGHHNTKEKIQICVEKNQIERKKPLRHEQKCENEHIKTEISQNGKKIKSKCVNFFFFN